MNKPGQVRIELNNVCHMWWEELSPVKGGRFCQQCNKCVKDFTSYSDAQLFHEFVQPGHASCGYFRKDQLDRLLSPEIHSAKKSLLKPILISVTLTIAVANHIHGRTPDRSAATASSFSSPEKYLPDDNAARIITGRVIDSLTSDPIGGAVVSIKNSKVSCSTSAYGEFRLLIPDSLRQDTFELHVRYIRDRRIDLKVVPGEDTLTIELPPSHIVIDSGPAVIIPTQITYMSGVPPLDPEPLVVPEPTSVVPRHPFWYRMFHPFRKR